MNPLDGVVAWLNRLAWPDREPLSAQGDQHSPLLPERVAGASGRDWAAEPHSAASGDLRASKGHPRATAGRPNRSEWIDACTWRDPDCIECGGEGAPCCDPPDSPPPADLPPCSFCAAQPEHPSSAGAWPDPNWADLLWQPEKHTGDTP